MPPRFIGRYAEMRSAEAERIVTVLAERAREILPSSEYEVVTSRGSLTIRGVGQNLGNTDGLLVRPIWLSPMPLDKRLNAVLDGLGRAVERCLTRPCGTETPVTGAEPHVRITDDTVRLWWGGPAEAEALVQVRPIARAEIGV